MCEVSRKFVNLSTNPALCIEQAKVNYRVSNASVSLMKEVVRCSESIVDDPVTEPLIKYMKKHIVEETGHDEWFLEDLNVLGVSRESVLASLPSLNLTTLMGSQYFWINHVDPVAFMGFLACTEIHHPTVEYVETLIKQSGLPAEGFSSLMHHANVDIHHKKEIINTLNSLPLTEEQFKLIELSAFQTYRYITLVMEDVCKLAPKETLAVA